MRLLDKPSHATKTGIILLIGLFLAFLIVGRLLWHEMFKPAGQPGASGGVLDLRGMEFESGRTLTLDGEWEFHPGVFLISGNSPARENTGQGPALVQVPGKWNDAMRPGNPTPYGYGSYLLRILLDPGESRIFSIYVPSVHSSAKLFVDGRLVHASGRPAPDADSYQAANEPFTAAFSAGDHEAIEVVFEAANYIAPLDGGLVRSLKFGLNEDIQRERFLSVLSQQFVPVVLLILSVYLLVLHFIDRNRWLLYFSMMLLSVAFLFSNSTGDKLLLQFLSINYEWNFRIVNLSVTLMLYAVCRAYLHRSDREWSARATLVLRIAVTVFAGLAVMLPVSAQYALRNTIFAVSAPTVLYILFSVAARALRGLMSNTMFILAALAVMNHCAWWAYYNMNGMKLLFYPFDLTLAIMMLSILWFGRYITLLREQQALAAKLQETERKRDEFLANTSHELRNPLHGILNLSQAVLERERHALSEQSVRDMGAVLSIGRQMSMMVDELLDFTRLKDGRIRLNLRPLSLHPVVNGVIDMVRHMAGERNVRLTNRIPADFPWLMADEGRLTQIVYNLLHNAVKFTPKGEIAVHAAVEDGMARISVSDTGIGMDEQTARRVFLPYEQASRHRGGIGLGLSISKQLVELHGGSIDVRSAPNRGSTFSFTLPLVGAAYGAEAQAAADAAPLVAAPAPADQPAAPPMPADDPPPSPVRDRPRILAVDDDVVNLNILVSVLSPDHYDIVTVTNPLEALELIETREWDLVICDVMMPHMSGYELVRMEAAWLQAQIEPHFYFNTLNSIAALQHTNPDQTIELIDHFSTFLREKYKFQNAADTVPLADEFQLVQSYLFIEQVRYGDLLRIHWEAGEPGDLRIPPYTLQPLVENAIRHGIMKRSGGGNLWVRLARLDGGAELSVVDDGVGMPEEIIRKLMDPSTASSNDFGIGLRNVDCRLRRNYGKGLRIESAPGEGTTISFFIRN